MKKTYYYWILLIDESWKISFKYGYLKSLQLTPGRCGRPSSILSTTRPMTSQLLTAMPQWLESLIALLLTSRWKHQDRPTQHLCQHQTATPSLRRSVMWGVCSKWGKQGRLPVQMVRQEGWWKCENHLSEVFTKIFKLSHLNPSSHLVPAPKKSINNLLCVWEAGPTAHQSLPSTFKPQHLTIE